MMHRIPALLATAVVAIVIAGCKSASPPPGDVSHAGSTPTLGNDAGGTGGGGSPGTDDRGTGGQTLPLTGEH